MIEYWIDSVLFCVCVATATFAAVLQEEPTPVADPLQSVVEVEASQADALALFERRAEGRDIVQRRQTKMALRMLANRQTDRQRAAAVRRTINDPELFEQFYEGVVIQEYTPATLAGDGSIIDAFIRLLDWFTANGDRLIDIIERLIGVVDKIPINEMRTLPVGSAEPTSIDRRMGLIRNFTLRERACN